MVYIIYLYVRKYDIYSDHFFLAPRSTFRRGTRGAFGVRPGRAHLRDLGHVQTPSGYATSSRGRENDVEMCEFEFG